MAVKQRRERLWVYAVDKYQIWYFDPWCVKFDTGVTGAMPAATPGYGTSRVLTPTCIPKKRAKTGHF